MRGTICIENLRVICLIGIHPKERQLPQALDFCVQMDLDIAEAAETETVGATIDYADVAARIEELAQEGAFKLIETLAESTASMIFDSYAVVDEVRIEIRKPSAIPAAAYASVIIERKRSEML